MSPRKYSVTFTLLLVVVALLNGAPLLTLAARLLQHLTFLNILFEKDTITALQNTIVSSFLALAASWIACLPVAWILARTDLNYRGYLRRLFFFPCMLPPFLFAIAWAALMIPHVGLLNRLVGANIFNIYSLTGLCWVFVSAYSPFMLLTLCQAMEAMDPSLEEAARVCGATPARVFFSITLPSLLPTIAASSILFLLETMSAFGIPAIVGSPGRIYLLTTQIYSAAKMGGLTGSEQAFSISIWLLILTAVFVIVNEKIARVYQVRLTTGKTPRHSLVGLGGKRLLIFVLLAAWSFILIALPLLALLLNSFLRVAGELEFSNFSFENYAYLFQSPEFLRSTFNSFYISLVAAALCTVLAFGVSYFSDRTTVKGKVLLLRLATFPYSVPGTILALAVIISYGAGWGIPALAMLGTTVPLVIAYTSKYLAFSAQNLKPALSNIDTVMDECARVCGATPSRVVLWILIPLLLPTIGNIFILTLLPMLSELTMSVLLAGPGTETIGVLLFQLQDYANPLAACALAVLIVLLLVFLGVGSSVVFKGKR